MLCLAPSWQNVLLSVRTKWRDELRLGDVQNSAKQYLCVGKYTYVLIFDAVYVFFSG